LFNIYRVLVEDSRLKCWMQLAVLRRILNVNTAEDLDPYYRSYYHNVRTIQTTAPCLPQTRQNCFIKGTAISTQR